MGSGLDITGNHFLDSAYFDDPIQDDRLPYLLQAPLSPVPSIIKGISLIDGMCRVQGEDFTTETLRVIQRSDDLYEWDAVDVSLTNGSDFEWIEPVTGEPKLFYRVLTEK